MARVVVKDDVATDSTFVREAVDLLKRQEAERKDIHPLTLRAAKNYMKDLTLVEGLIERAYHIRYAFESLDTNDQERLRIDIARALGETFGLRQ